MKIALHKRSYHFIVAALLMAAMPNIANGQLPQLTGAQWREDLQVLRTRLPAAHGHLFHLLPEDEFDAMLDSLIEVTDRASSADMLIGIARVVAAVGEGHTSARILLPAMSAYPVLTQLQHDGLRVRRVPEKHRELLGSRVLGVEGQPIEDVTRRLASVISADNAMGIDAWLPFYLATREVLLGLGLSDDTPGLTLRLEMLDGRKTDLVLAAQPLPDVQRLLLGRVSGMAVAGDRAPPRIRDNRTGSYWSKWIPEHNALFVRIDRLVDEPRRTFATFIDSLFADIDVRDPQRVILDLRSLSGGNHISLPLIHALIQREEFADSGRIIVLIGRNTFSAGQNLVTLLQQHVQPIFIGEPTGGRPNSYGVLGRFKLPNSALEIRHSRYFIQDSDPADYRHWQEPHILAPPDVRAELAGRDPALDKALQFNGEFPWSAALQAIRSTADTADASSVLALGRRHLDMLREGGATVEQELNRIGYARLRGGAAAEAAEIFRWNTELFPHAWNAWDSLAESLAGLGKYEEARKAYARSLALNGYNENARRGLRLLELEKAQR